MYHLKFKIRIVIRVTHRLDWRTMKLVSIVVLAMKLFQDPNTNEGYKLMRNQNGTCKNMNVGCFPQFATFVLFNSTGSASVELQSLKNHSIHLSLLQLLNLIWRMALYSTLVPVDALFWLSRGAISARPYLRTNSIAKRRRSQTELALSLFVIARNRHEKPGKIQASRPLKWNQKPKLMVPVKRWLQESFK